MGDDGRADRHDREAQTAGADVDRPRTAMLVARSVVGVTVGCRVGEMPFRRQVDRVLHQLAHSGNERQQKNEHERPRGESCHARDGILRVNVRQEKRTRAVRDEDRRPGGEEPR